MNKLAPALIAEWHPAKNGISTPDQFTSGSRKKVWWLCEKGHEWEAQVSARSIQKQGCPYCANRKVLAGFNDLATTNPGLASEWHPTRNGEVTPSEVAPFSHTKAWWLGECGHEWDASVSRRSAGQGCPYCANRKILVGFNDLATTHPDLASEWHPTKNRELTPEMLVAGSNRKVWWLCEKGHEWEACPNKRAYGTRQGCPFCLGSKVVEDVNSFLKVHPDLALEWHPTKNGDVTPNLISKNSGKRIWWLCERGHEWEASVTSRSAGQGCPYCSNQRLLVGFNDLATTHAHLATQWHPVNNEVTADSVVYGSTTRIWWVCEKNHEWETEVRFRTHRKTGCPKCAGPISQMERDVYAYLVELGFTAEQSNKTVLKDRAELDIYIPEKQFAVEFNGLYWHTEEQGKHRTYHYDKWLQCKQKGIQLVQIWEDEWVRNPDQVKRMLAHKLGVSLERKVYARKTRAIEISKQKAEVFLNQNHIQGFAAGSYYLGLEELGSEELVAVLVLKKEAGTDGRTLNIIRYATSVSVVGGFTKLLKHTEKTYKPEKLITFSDHCVSDGRLYENNGFIADKELPPDYMYVVKGVKKHKFGYRLKKFRDDPNLLWEEGLSERELAALNGLPRIWDAGKTRWVKEIKAV